MGGLGGWLWSRAGDTIGYHSYSKCISKIEISMLLAFIFHNSFSYLKYSIVFEFIF